MFMTITTTYFRENLADVINRIADDGEEVILVFGKGKKSKKISMSPVVRSKKKQNMPNLKNFLESDAFKNIKPLTEFQNAKDFKEIMDKYYTPRI